MVESKNRSRTIELRSFSCPNRMHEFEFEVRISAQIQTVKMAVGRNLKFEILFGYCEFSCGKNTPHAAKITAHTCEAWSTHAKFDGFYSAQRACRSREVHAPCSHMTAVTYASALLRGLGVWVRWWWCGVVVRCAARGLGIF